MVYNISSSTFGPLGTRNGDLIAILNIIQHMRLKENDPSIKFHFLPGALNKEDYIYKFFRILSKLTDCFSEDIGTMTLPWKDVSVWDYRDIIGDHVTIKNPYSKEKKVVIFPLYDAKYNVQRNWSKELFAEILEECNTQYPDHKKIICSKDMLQSDMNPHGFEVSYDFETNINHIMTADIFYGGDTGVSHFASALDNGPHPIYLYSSRCLIHTIPFHYLDKRKGEFRKFWVNFTGAKL